MEMEKNDFVVAETIERRLSLANEKTAKEKTGNSS